MPHHVERQRIARTADEVFEFVGPNIPENNPRYEREVIDWVDVSPRPIRVGTTAVMRRVESGKRRDVHVVCVDYQQGRRIAWKHTDPSPFRVDIAFETVPAGTAQTDLSVTVDITLAGPPRLISPIVQRRSGAKGKELVTRIRTIIETGTGALSPRPEVAQLAQ
jgi:hypothetical protein